MGFNNPGTLMGKFCYQLPVRIVGTLPTTCWVPALWLSRLPNMETRKPTDDHETSEPYVGWVWSWTQTKLFGLVAIHIHMWAKISRPRLSPWKHWVGPSRWDSVAKTAQRLWDKCRKLDEFHLKFPKDLSANVSTSPLILSIQSYSMTMGNMTMGIGGQHDDNGAMKLTSVCNIRDPIRNDIKCHKDWSSAWRLNYIKQIATASIIRDDRDVASWLKLKSQFAPALVTWPQWYTSEMGWGLNLEKWWESDKMKTWVNF